MKIDLSAAKEKKNIYQSETTNVASTRALIQFDTNLPSFPLDTSIAIESYESHY